jgi:hypothetical protein
MLFRFYFDVPGGVFSFHGFSLVPFSFGILLFVKGEIKCISKLDQKIFYYSFHFRVISTGLPIVKSHFIIQIK